MPAAMRQKRNTAAAAAVCARDPPRVVYLSPSEAKNATNERA